MSRRSPRMAPRRLHPPWPEGECAEDAPEELEWAEAPQLLRHERQEGAEGHGNGRVPALPRRFRPRRARGRQAAAERIAERAEDHQADAATAGAVCSRAIRRLASTGPREAADRPAA